jgi:hypothetical protein
VVAAQLIRSYRPASAAPAQSNPIQSNLIQSHPPPASPPQQTQTQQQSAKTQPHNQVPNKHKPALGHVATADTPTLPYPRRRPVKTGVGLARVSHGLVAGREGRCDGRAGAPIFHALVVSFRFEACGRFEGVTAFLTHFLMLDGLMGVGRRGGCARLLCVFLCVGALLCTRAAAARFPKVPVRCALCTCVAAWLCLHMVASRGHLLADDDRDNNMCALQKRKRVPERPCRRNSRVLQAQGFVVLRVRVGCQVVAGLTWCLIGLPYPSVNPPRNRAPEKRIA